MSSGRPSSRRHLALPRRRLLGLGGKDSWSHLARDIMLVLDRREGRDLDPVDTGAIVASVTLQLVPAAHSEPDAAVVRHPVLVNAGDPGPHVEYVVDQLELGPHLVVGAAGRLPRGHKAQPLHGGHLEFNFDVASSSRNTRLSLDPGELCRNIMICTQKVL